MPSDEIKAECCKLIEISTAILEGRDIQWRPKPPRGDREMGWFDLLDDEDAEECGPLGLNWKDCEWRVKPQSSGGTERDA